MRGATSNWISPRPAPRLRVSAVAFGRHYAAQCLFLMLFSFAGCDSRTNTPAPPPAPVITGNGIIRGIIRFQGTPPVMRDIPNVPCHTGAPPQKEETVIVSPTGGLKNVIVSLEGLGPGAPRASSPAVLDQKDCRYVPHVIAITAGQPLTIHSSDDTMHNVHIEASQNPPVNLGMTAAGQQKTVTFAHPEIMRVKCDVHPWMTAWIAVFENPLFAITNADGSFQITGVPPGTYTLTAWHELYGTLKQQIIVKDDQPADVSLTYRQQ